MKSLALLLLWPGTLALAQVPAPGNAVTAEQETNRKLQEGWKRTIRPAWRGWGLHASPQVRLEPRSVPNSQPGVRLLQQTPLRQEVCSIPLHNVLPAAPPSPMPRVAPRPTGPMPFVSLPAPPCKE